MNITIYNSAKKELNSLLNTSEENKNYIRIFIRTLSF